MLSWAWAVRAVAVAVAAVAVASLVSLNFYFLRLLLPVYSSKAVNKYERLLFLRQPHSEDTPLENIAQKRLYLRILHTYSAPI